MRNDYKDMRIKAEQIKRKINNAENITSEDLETLRKYAQASGNAANITAYAIGKHYVKDEE